MSYQAQSAQIANGGSGYAVNDILLVSGGTLTQQAQFKVTAVQSGVVTAITPYLAGLYSDLPANPDLVTGGTGSGCQLIISWTAIVPSGPPTPRTTPALVSQIVQVQDGVDLSPFISIANQMTTDVCTYPQPGQDPTVFKPYTDGYVGSKMELIERWLAAHFYTIFDNQLSQAKAGTVSVGFQFKIDMNLKSSMYGQSAMTLDNYGGLAALTNTINTKRQIKVSISWLGKRRCRLGDLNASDITIEQ